MHASGVLAVIACGMVMSRESSLYLSGSVRLELDAVWNALTFVLNGLVFVLIGLQLPYVLAGIHGTRLWTLIAYGAGFSVLLIVMRLVWVFTIRYARYWIGVWRFSPRILLRESLLPCPHGPVLSTLRSTVWPQSSGGSCH